MLKKKWIISKRKNLRSLDQTGHIKTAVGYKTNGKDALPMIARGVNDKYDRISHEEYHQYKENGEADNLFSRNSHRNS